MVFTGQGVLTQIELVGPASFEMWEASYKVMVHAMGCLQVLFWAHCPPITSSTTIFRNAMTNVSGHYSTRRMFVPVGNIW